MGTPPGLRSTGPVVEAVAASTAGHTIRLIYANLIEFSWKALSEWAFLCDSLLCSQRSHISYSEDFAVCLEITKVDSTVYRHVGMLACCRSLPRKPLIAKVASVAVSPFAPLSDT